VKAPGATKQHTYSKAEISVEQTGIRTRHAMSEFSEFAWGIPDVKRDLSYPSLTDEESPATAIAAFKALILERPDVGNLCMQLLSPEFFKKKLMQTT